MFSMGHFQLMENIMTNLNFAQKKLGMLQASLAKTQIWVWYTRIVMGALAARLATDWQTWELSTVLASIPAILVLAAFHLHFAGRVALLKNEIHFLAGQIESGP
ncbi:hypothetical protein HDN1F_35420 [gamma proteobacterium HdN1]|nr:Hypothetical protein HDN1F_17770 [gamma proteobacterium HdN1]CBL47125.1 hypothetical protein HDN1F_35420 [gamma proteobacterium HdN1]